MEEDVLVFLGEICARYNRGQRGELFLTWIVTNAAKLYIEHAPENVTSDSDTCPF
jgi:hypothetical protein